jgi:hypothetical protein
MKIAESYIERMTYVQPRLDENNNPFRIVDHGRHVSPSQILQRGDHHNMIRSRFWKIIGHKTYPYDIFAPKPKPDKTNPNLVSSLTANGKQAPAIDLDIPHQYVPSSTPGHGHLYLDIEMPWWKYRMLLWVMLKCGIIERGFYNAAKIRKMTMLRPPGVKKVN